MSLESCMFVEWRMHEVWHIHLEWHMHVEWWRLTHACKVMWNAACIWGTMWHDTWYDTWRDTWRIRTYKVINCMYKSIFVIACVVSRCEMGLCFYSYRHKLIMYSINQLNYNLVHKKKKQIQYPHKQTPKSQNIRRQVNENRQFLNPCGTTYRISYLLCVLSCQRLSQPATWQLLTAQCQCRQRMSS